jgi:hypothetical protein
MKITLIFASIGCALLLGGCVDNSLVTDEEYRNSKPPAPHPADYSKMLPQERIDPNTRQPY